MCSKDGSIVITTLTNIPPLEKIITDNHQLETTTSKVYNCASTWTIQNFKLLHGTRLESEVFSPKDINYKWYLELSNGGGNSWQGSFLDIALIPYSIDSYDDYCKLGGATGEIELALVDNDGKQKYAKKYPFNAEESFDENRSEYSSESNYERPEVHIDKFIEHSELFLETNASLLPGGALTIYCHVSFVLTNKIKTKVENGFSRYFDNEESSDLRIKLMGKEYPAHKFVLAAQSPVFKNMFERDAGENQQDRNSIVIWDIAEDVFLEMLRFIYTSRVEKNKLKDTKFISGLLIAAKKYNIKGLKKICKRNQPKQKDDKISKLVQTSTPAPVEPPQNYNPQQEVKIVQTSTPVEPPQNCNPHQEVKIHYTPAKRNTDRECVGVMVMVILGLIAILIMMMIFLAAVIIF